MSDTFFMQKALALAGQALEQKEVPIGAVVVLNNNIIGKGFNQPITGCDMTAHAEIIAMREAAKSINNYRLKEATLYTTLEPCCMCAGAIVHARIKYLVIGARDEKAGACGSCFNLVNGFPLNHKVDVSFGLMAKEAATLLQEFFKARR